MTAKILVVDDEPLLEYVIQQKFRQKIRAKEFEFLFANNGKQALEKLAENPAIELVLTDINMPEMDGLTLLEKLAEGDRTLKAVVVSAYGDLSNIRTAMNRGAFDFLTKPIDFRDMEIIIQRTLDFVKRTREDLTKLQQTQTQLIQNEKMASIGQLIAGVAHEINNPVSFISGNLDHARNYFKDLLHIINLYQKHCQDNLQEIEAEIEALDLPFILEDLPQMLDSMTEGTDRIRHLSESLRTFSRADSSNRVSFNLHAGIDSTLIILRHRLKGNDNRPEIQVIREYGELPEVQCYPGPLNQVFMNIIANAIDALDESSLKKVKGEIENNLETHPNQITIKTAAIAETDTDRKMAAIRILDNGLGMTAEIQKQIFEHLFTTKPVGQGTGLGLSISRQIIIEKHEGNIKCISSPGEGTEFIIEIPL
ncbi:response regulator [Spirulina sp. 06S082]|uniref:hybrid sensor histidine kinase/response regulator n=1 Tax=Spirulina sp. 06S082 TaxID=3110248 RepID=UPI002B20B3DB|nr:response regulator [Spirulina sp. 06S082]MEA5470283.1 response regulator [Spirulina sp. 06S082]